MTSLIGRARRRLYAAAAALPRTDNSPQQVDECVPVLIQSHVACALNRFVLVPRRKRKRKTAAEHVVSSKVTRTPTSPQRRSRAARRGGQVGGDAPLADRAPGGRPPPCTGGRRGTGGRERGVAKLASPALRRPHQGRRAAGTRATRLPPLRRGCPPHVPNRSPVRALFRLPARVLAVSQSPGL